MRVRRISKSTRGLYEAGIRGLEDSATYPLGDDRFRIDHGVDYFAFFDRLGDASFYAVFDDDRVIAVAAAILRRVPLERGGRLRSAWYLCDLKIHPDYRGLHLPLRMLAHALPRNYFRCPRGYAISMNSPGEQENRVKLLLERFRPVRLSGAGTLAIYSLSCEEFLAVRSLVERHRGPVSFLALAGVKDIVLESTGAPMPLAHVQFGPCADTQHSEPLDGFVHMFCTPSGGGFDQDLHARGICPSASATLIQHRMRACDWRFVLTSDI